MKPHLETKAAKRSLSLPYWLLGVAFLLGLMPTAMNLIVDPYQVFRAKDRPTAINDLAEKTHYPLWKLAKYQPGRFDTIVLGDSRARALRDKYWREAGMPNALNLAYGGGTIPEIFSTFNLIKNDRKIRRLVIGMQLRSFDEDHKGGMNRVPEAISLLSNRFSYLKNWHVAKTSLNVFKAENPHTTKRIYGLINQLSLDANAADLGAEGATPLKKLLEPRICFGCVLPDQLHSVPYVRTGTWHRGGYGHHYRSLYLDLEHRGDRVALPAYYHSDLTHYAGLSPDDLPRKYSRQVIKNGSSDWRGFEESETYWTYLETISKWAKSRKIELVFVVPPTITAMQQTISDNGLASNNHAFRMRLAGLGKVVDLDFPNSLTGSLANFSDAYHFNSKVARAIVAQVVGQFKESRKPKRRSTNFELSCPGRFLAEKKRYRFKKIYLHQGKNCRIWETSS